LLYLVSKKLNKKLNKKIKMKRKFRLQLIEELDSKEIIVINEGIAALDALYLKRDFGIDPFQMMAETLLKEVEDKKLPKEN